MKQYLKYILPILTVFLFSATYTFASSVQNSQTDGTNKLGLASPPSVFTNTFTPSADYSAVRLEVQGSNPSGVDLYGHHVYLTLKTYPDETTIASCDVSANTLTTDSDNPTWTGCNITATDLSSGQEYEMTLLGYDYWVINGSGNMNYKVYGNVGGGGGGGGGGVLGTLITLPSNAVASLTGAASQIMTDIWALLAFFVGVPLGFYLIRKLVLVFQRPN